VPSYLVEVYLPRSRADQLGATASRARAAAEELSPDGALIRHVRTTFLPDDETCFHFFDAASSDVVEEAIRRANLGRGRVALAVEESLSELE
jgi:hypothetical protein